METVTFELDYATSKLVIAGEPDAMCWLRNIVMDAARYHKEARRYATAEYIVKLWDAMDEARSNE